MVYNIWLETRAAASGVWWVQAPGATARAVADEVEGRLADDVLIARYEAARARAAREAALADELRARYPKCCVVIEYDAVVAYKPSGKIAARLAI